MECELMQNNLVYFQMGNIEDRERLRCEQHLAECADCLCDFWEVKAACEREPLPCELPSDDFQEKLERFLMRRVPVLVRPVVRYRWQVAASLAIVAILTLVRLGYQGKKENILPALGSGTLIDSSRSVSLSSEIL